ncbi:hypothetical protein HAX54_029592 [Datura stramonium]|uniref:Uncharacterized protein n=1 Tax=Datura stramonium TaxID=4076 RepID=A0ABS8V918_DATST|nr:hypothetical protein [Datura stramonium]
MACHPTHCLEDCFDKFLGIGRTGSMASHIDKVKEVAVASKGFKRLKKGVASSSSSQKAPPSRRFGAKAVEEHGLKWFNASEN